MTDYNQKKQRQQNDVELQRKWRQAFDPRSGDGEPTHLGSVTSQTWASRRRNHGPGAVFIREATHCHKLPHLQRTAVQDWNDCGRQTLFFPLLFNDKLAESRSLTRSVSDWNAEPRSSRRAFERGLSGKSQMKVFFLFVCFVFLA